jgi:site-specific recombinase XerC
MENDKVRVIVYALIGEVGNSNPFLGHSKLETTQIYAESTTEMLKESYRRALTE